MTFAATKRRNKTFNQQKEVKKLDKKGIDACLVGMRNGSNADFERLYLATKRGIYSFLYTYFHDPHSAEDAMQWVYLKIKRNIGSYRPGSNGMAWMLEIAKNHALDEIKKSKRVTYELPDELLGSENMRDISVSDIIERTLDEVESRILVLHVVWGYKHREIGAMLGLPTGTVTSKYKRSIEKVRRAYEEGGA